MVLAGAAVPSPRRRGRAGAGYPHRRLDHGHDSRQAQRVFRERCDFIPARIAAIGVTPPERFRLREMKSRWGSFSAKGQISLNLKLIQVDKSMIDYVILHELCHLRELNHSRAFYALLDRVVPDWNTLRAKLNRSEVGF